MISEWGNKIYTAISNEKIFSKDCDTQNFIIRNHYPSGYEAIYSLISANNPNTLTHPVDIIAAHPTKLKVRDPLSKYFHRYKDYLELRAYLNNDSSNINDPDEFDTFMIGADHCFNFRILSHEDRHSRDKKKRHKYPRG